MTKVILYLFCSKIQIEEILLSNVCNPIPFTIPEGWKPPDILFTSELKSKDAVYLLPLQNVILPKKAHDTGLRIEFRGNEFYIGLSPEIIKKIKRKKILTVSRLLQKFEKGELRGLNIGELQEIWTFFAQIHKCF